MSEPSTFTLGEAARVTGRSKSTISKAIKSGRLSAMSREGGQFQISAAELFRCFPVNGSGNGEIERSETPQANGRTVPISTLEAELLGVRGELEQVKSERDDLRRRLDIESEERRRLTAILTHQREHVPAADPPSRSRRRWSFWRRTSA